MGRSIRRFAAFAALMLSAGSVWAGAPSATLTADPLDLLFTSHGLHQPVTQTFTVSAGNNGTPGAMLGAFSFNGPNSSDFSIVGGTCTQGMTLDVDMPSCTVTLQYLPSTTGPEGEAQLQVSCTTLGAAGGTFVVCNGTSQTLNFFSGIVAAAIAQLPTLDSRLLTLLAGLIMALGVFYAMRKSA